MSLTIVRKKLTDLREDPKNARKHPARNLAAVRGSLERFGQRTPLVIRPDGTIVGGNATWSQMKALGWEECDAVVFEGTDQEATALGIALNRTADLAAWNEDVLQELLTGLDRDLALAAGFMEAELSMLGATLEGVDAPAMLAPLEPASRAGDLWILGNHRLLCGDSSKEVDVNRLLAGAPIHLVNTDPPYNVKVEPRSNNAIAAGLSSFTTTHHQGLDLARHPSKATPTHDRLRAKDRPLANDFISEEDFDAILRAWFGNVARVLLPGRAFYIWGGYANLANYPSALRECGLYFSQGIVWDKQHPVLTRKDFMGAFELAFYGWREGAAHQFYGPANVPDLWHVKKLNHTAMVHLTEKPVELATMAMEYSSQLGENVLDLFGGSGSTLMGAEQTGRRAFLMELDGAYNDVIVTRWQSATGREATLDGDGRTFAQVAAERVPVADATTEGASNKA